MPYYTSGVPCRYSFDKYQWLNVDLANTPHLLLIMRLLTNKKIVIFEKLFLWNLYALNKILK